MTNTTEAQADSVGALLRQSREQKGLTTADVATQLRLKVSQIEQIEAEQWDPAVSATFMRGYLRAYARLLKLSEKEILQNFELQTAYLRNQAKPMHSFSKKNRLDAVDNRFMLASYLLVVLLIGLFLIWFWQTHWLDSQPVSVVPEYRVSGEPANIETSAAPTVTSAGNDRPVESATPATTLTTTAASAGTPVAVVTEPTPEPVNEQPANGSTQNEPNLSAQPLSAPAQIATPAAADAALAAAPTETASAARLQLTFSAECWITVHDASGARLAYGIQSAGQSLQLTGQLPFSVTLGNAAAAQLLLNDTAVDLSGYQAGQVARLTLDGQP